MIYGQDYIHHFSIPAETIVLVIFLAGLMGITRIPMPTKYWGGPIKVGAYPPLCGLISGFMDSFLVLLLLKSMKMSGERRDQQRFLIYCMVAALIGGLITYFGEVYMLPLALKYQMREWHSMLPIVPPILIFLGILWALARRLPLSVTGMGANWETNGDSEITNDDHHTTHDVRQNGGLKEDYLEFIGFIGLLLIFHNPLFCLGSLLLYASVTGQGHQLIKVVLLEMEVTVMLLLLLATLVAQPVSPFIQDWSGYWAFIPSTLNAVLTGAIFPASGDVWKDTVILSTAALMTPLSSLVGVMLFKSIKEWGFYCRVAIPLAAVWAALCATWFLIPWQWWQDDFYRVLPRPQLVEASVPESPAEH